MSAPHSYEDLTANFEWNVAEQELGYEPGDPINIGWMCSDRICQRGLADKWALLWEDYQGNEKRFTYDDVRILSNTVAHFLSELDLRPAERVCLFMDRVPELYIGFLGILKTGAVAQPLFSAFGDESLFVRLADAKTSAILTQKKHLHKVRKIRNRLPSLRHIIVVDQQVPSLPAKAALAKGTSKLQTKPVPVELARSARTTRRRVRAGGNEVEYIGEDVTVRHFTPQPAPHRVRVRENKVAYIGEDVTVRHFTPKPAPHRVRVGENKVAYIGKDVTVRHFTPKPAVVPPTQSVESAAQPVGGSGPVPR